MTWPVGMPCASLARSSLERFREELAQIKSRCSSPTESRPGTWPWLSAYINWRSHEAWDNPSRSGKRQVRRDVCTSRSEEQDRVGCSGRMARDKGAQKSCNFLKS